MKKKKKRKHYRHKKPIQPTPRPAVNPLQRSIEIINDLKPVMAAVQRAAQRQRERDKEKKNQ